jgi:iron complex outermembrane receptor protein
LALLIAQVASGASEEEELALVYGDQSTVSIATGSRQELRRAPSVATVITAEDIAAMGAVDLDQILEAVPGMHVSRTNQVYAPLYVIRGIQSEFNPQTLVLQNGVPMTTLFVGNRGLLWAGLPVEHIARVEVIRGPGSALYGADAYAGVVNIITKTAVDTPGTEAGRRRGSFDSSDAWVQHGSKFGSLDVAGYLRAGHTDGFRSTVTTDAQTGLDSAFGTSISLAPGPVNTGHDALDANLDLGYGQWRWRTNYKLRENVGTGAGIASALDPVGKGKSERFTSDLSLTDLQVATNLRMGFVASYFYYTNILTEPLQLFPPGAFGGAFPNGMIGAPNTWERHIRVSTFLIYSGFTDHNLRIGIGHDDLNLYRTQEFKNFTIDSSGLPVPTPGAQVIEFPVDQSFLTPHRRKVSYAYLQDEWRLARDWALTAGVRHDDYSDVGDTTNPRLALVWDAALDVTAKLLYGRAFRPPAYTEQYSINNPVILGNPNLKPETISTVEAVLAWQARKNTHVSLSVFHYEMDDIIRTTTEPSTGVQTFNNTGRQTGRGAELELVWDVERNLRVSGNYAYQRSIDEATDQDAGYAPHHHVYARTDWRFVAAWQLSGQVNYVADRKRAAGDNRPPISDYTTVDLTLRSNRGKDRFDIAASVRNLFDADVREPSRAPGTALPNDLPMAPRSVYLQASYRL